MQHRINKDIIEKFNNFAEVIQYIEEHYTYNPGGFKNGKLINKSTENQGSAKVLYFAHLNCFTQLETLLLFQEHYEHVLLDPEGNNHLNIRNFMEYGWEGVSFDSIILE